MDFTHLIIERQGRVALLTLNRPEKLNALSIELQEEIVRALKEVETHPEVRVAIIKGAGRAFCAGYDIEPGGSVSYRERTILADKERLEAIASRWLKLWECSKPVIAQVHGMCLAGGTDMALLADVVIAAEDARIGHPGVRGIGTPLTQMWAYLIGPMRAKMLMLTGDTISGREAADWGLVAKAVPPDRLESEALRLARRMAAVPVELLSINKALVNRVIENMGLRQSIQNACELDSMSHFTPPVREFWEILNSQGLKAALKWRDRDFKDES